MCIHTFVFQIIVLKIEVHIKGGWRGVEGKADLGHAKRSWSIVGVFKWNM